MDGFDCLEVMADGISQEDRLTAISSAKLAHEQVHPHAYALTERQLPIQGLGNQLRDFFTGTHVSFLFGGLFEPVDLQASLKAHTRTVQYHP